MKDFFQEILKSIRDFKFYTQAKDFQLGKGLKYLFLLVLLVTIALSLRYSYDFKRGLNIAVNWAMQNIPVIEIQNGIVAVNVKQPYKVTEGGFTFIIDTTGEITSLDEYEKGVLLTKDKVMYKESDLKTEAYKLSNIQALRIDENFIKALRKNALWVIFPIMFIVLYVGFSIARFFQILIFSVISVVVSSIANVKLRYRQLFNIGVYAITPSTILGALLPVLGVRLPLFAIIYSGLYVIYLIMAILNCKEEPAKEDISF